MINEKAIVLLSLVFFLIVFAKPSFANSSYVLPYPSVMPGGISYKFHVIYEQISKYWYFGNFGQFEYNLKLSDKYLVEAKTLFEYRQYLLAYNALEKSNNYFKNIYIFLENAKKNNVDISQKKDIFIEAINKHIEVLDELRDKEPKSFVWTPEKSAPVNLNIEKLIDNSIVIRKNYQ